MSLKIKAIAALMSAGALALSMTASYAQTDTT